MAYSTADILKGKKDGEGGGIEGYDAEQTRCLGDGERWHKPGIPDEFEGQRVAVIYNKIAGTENVKGSVAAAVAERIAECPQKKKIRKDAVRYLVARANMPDYSQRSQEEREEWVRRVRGFLPKSTARTTLSTSVGTMTRPRLICTLRSFLSPRTGGCLPKKFLNPRKRI